MGKKFGMFNRRGNRSPGIDPDEIFLDSSNLPAFDTSQFEGRIERPIGKRTFFYVGIAAFLLIGVMLSRVWFLQVVEGSAYRTLSEENRLTHSVLFAERGILYDRSGVELAWNEPGETPFAKRLYTGEAGFAHILGYSKPPQQDSSGNFYQYTYTGVAGAEAAFSERLSGTYGIRVVETNARSQEQVGSAIRLPKDGLSIRLSIDSLIQAQMHRYIAEVAESRGFTGGAGVLIDIESGEIIALTNYPEYTPQSLTDGDATAIGELQRSTRTPFLNRAVSGLYAPGSIIKPFIAVAALEEGVVTPTETIYSSGKLIVPNPYVPSNPTIYSDWGAPAHGANDITRALAFSSNVYFLTVGGGTESHEGLGIARIEEYARLFGFGSSTPFILSDGVNGTIPNPQWKEAVFGEEWRLGNTYLTAIGQYGFQVTPLQVVRAIGGVAGGALPNPQMVSEGRTREVSPLPFSEENLSYVRQGMRRAVLEGTAKGLNLSYLEVAGKTGTAELGVSKNTVNSWVTGFFPYENPRYAFVVLMEGGPRANSIGGVYVMRQLFDWMHTTEHPLLEERE